MMKTIAIIFLCNLISINFINASYPAQKCYVCDKKGCDHPGASDIKSCTDTEDEGTSGKTFVNGALGGSNVNDIYNTVGKSLATFTGQIGLNSSTAPSWESLTRWVCYVSKDKHRGCLVMGKGFCSGDKSWLAQIADIGKKIASIMDKAKDAVNKMFTASNGSLNDIQKSNISTWMAENYMAQLVNNSNDPQYQLESCCEGDACNFASMIQKSTAILILLVLSTLILV